MSIELYSREGSPYWYARITVGGTTRRVSTRVPCSRSTRTQAAKKAEELELELERELLAEKYASLRDALSGFLTGKDWSSPATLRAYTGYVADLYEEIDTDRVFLNEITPTWVRQHFAAFRSKFSRNKVRMLRTVLSGAIDHAILCGLLGSPEINPFKVVEKLVPKPPRAKKQRAMTLSQVGDLLTKVRGDPFWEPFLILIVETGMRHQEALQLTWDEVDLTAGVVTLGADRDKAGKGKVIPLSDHALSALSTVPKYPQFKAVWISRRTREPLKDIELRWRSLRVKLGYPKLRIHDLRHTFITTARRSGMSREDRMSIAGHSSTETHAIYAEAEILGLRSAVNQHSVCSLLAQQRENSTS